MKVKKYVAATMPEAMHQIRKELGADAVILNSKEVRNGSLFGLFKKRSIEVIAALDPQPTKPKPEVYQSLDKAPHKKVQSDQSINKNVLSEIKHLKKLLEVQNQQVKTNFTSQYNMVYQHLIDQEVSQSLASKIVRTVIDQHKNDSDSEPEQHVIFQDTMKEITSQLLTLSFEGITYNKRIIHFVGPTGVGKTTTIAKVAADSVLNNHKKVAFITADTYRIAAIEQLKTYAKILDVPLAVAYDNKDYKEAVEKFADYDLILVDTAGRNFRDPKYVHELEQSIDFNDEIETYLVLSLTAKPNDLQKISEQFQHIAIKEFIFTKIDETRQYGSMINLALQNQVGIAYMTNGQDVPDDIVKPSPVKISEYIVGEYRDE
ncbi:flagellar biosynthesis protein FlhF [Virgibacillus necropolis]|uniref:Flagellar biosynthesis protein FlhF n=1 Tax=Virgibacillus necropolis TaxID=163877 RepID=A0A221MDN4_9BACI|nr:flagellar biosynthesis protein FlhF [Virgibacillus necropolis]ASN05710.1 flagellar biosynthesis protein FlhF [Virgibacillus necropolis]